jgi:hypothetical protein
MQRNLIAALFLIVTAVFGCENFYDDTDEYEERIAQVSSVRIDTIVNMTASVSITCGTPTPCWSFSRVEETRDSVSVRWTVYQKVKKNITCVQMTGSFTQTLEITVPKPGTYTLKIYRTPITTLDTTIVF